MSSKKDIVDALLSHCSRTPMREYGQAFAPTNIALCKYWGKRDQILNLPMTSSLSISLGDKGATTKIKQIDASTDQVLLNGKSVLLETAFSQRLTDFLDLYRPTPKTRYHIETQMNIPVAAGLASSACGFAALVMALDHYYGWSLDQKDLSILARLGSGSASRSVWSGFVEWKKGSASDGMDSHGHLLSTTWPEFRVGLHILNAGEKIISSREAMRRTVETSQLYKAWPAQVEQDMLTLQQAITTQDFESLGATAENNALAMHATMMSARSAILYSQPETIMAMQKVWQLRAQGIPVYFTQDAGPNLKLLFLESVTADIDTAFPDLIICEPFCYQSRHCERSEAI